MPTCRAAQCFKLLIGIEHIYVLCGVIFLLLLILKFINMSEQEINEMALLKVVPLISLGGKDRNFNDRIFYTQGAKDCNLKWEQKLSKLNMNDYITIYPNEKGFRKIKELTAINYKLSNEEAEQWVKERKTKENGYKDQMWVIISDLHDMFFNGQNFMDTSHFSFL